MISRHALLLSAVLLASVGHAQSQTFKVGAGTPAQQLAQFESVTDFESITGTTAKVTGQINFDPKTKKGGGKIVVDVASLDTGIALRNDHMRGEAWLNAAKFPTLVFEATKTTYKSGDDYTVTGKLTIHGVTKEVTVPVKLSYRKSDSTTQGKGFKGDIVRLQASFKVKLSDYGVTIPAPAKDKVSPSITVRVTAFGQTGV